MCKKTLIALAIILFGLGCGKLTPQKYLIILQAGTEWAKALLDPEHKLRPAYEKLDKLGVTQIICDFCSRAFQVQDNLKKGKIPLVAEFEGHPSLVKWIKQGYMPIVL